MGRSWIAGFLWWLCMGLVPAAALNGPAMPGVPAVPVPGAAETGAPVEAAAATELRGTFRVTAGSCGGAVTGSWFRMIQPGGNPDSGPFVENADSPCADKTYTPLSPGTDGGLISGSHQPQPSNPFDGTGNGLAGRIVRPQRFFGVNFAMATNTTDPQTGTGTAAPVLRHDGGKLSGDLRAVGVAWNRQHFNQGAPKPDGSTPGQTRLVSGTVDTATRAYRMTWSSTIVGGPFNNFTGLWHLEGTFSGSLGGTQGAPTTPVDPPAGGPAPGSGGDAAGPSTPNTGPGVAAWPALGALLAAGLAHRARRHRA